MEIREQKNFCIVAPLSQKLDKRESLRLIEYIKSESAQTAIDLNYVQECTIDFINSLKEICKIKPVSIFNIPSNIFVLFNIMNLDKCISLYVSELDFEEGTRRLVNRKFNLV